MTPSPDVTAKQQVSESILLFLHAQIVEYNLRGDGARFYDPPPWPTATDAIESSLAEGRSKQPEEETDTDSEYASASESDALDKLSAPILSAKRKRLEALGQDVGTRLAEKHMTYRDKLEQDLEMVKFICKDFWEMTFRKQIDVLRTNHRGLYVLTDNNFHWLSSVAKTKQHAGAPEDFVVFPCGVICGALTRLGLRCRVTADLFPAPHGFRCSFNVQLIQS